VGNASSAASIVRFGIYEMDLRTGELRKAGIRIKLQEQPFKVLKAMLERPGEVVSREELRRCIWPEESFGDFDHAVNIAVGKLRSALDDSADTPRFIETVPRRGYRFIAPTETSTTAAETALLPARRITSSLRKSWGSYTLLAFLMIIAAAVTIFYLRRPPILTNKDSIVLADFSNSTGEVVFDTTLREGLAVLLGQSPFLNIVSDEKIAQTLHQMQQPYDVRLTKELARQVCERANATILISGSIAKLGNSYVIGLEASNCVTGDVLVRDQGIAAGQPRVLQTLEQETKILRQKLGESPPSLSRFNARLEEATTPSLDALKAYSVAMRVYSEKGETEAIPFLEHAIELDPNFALAYGWLGVAYQNLGETALSSKFTTKAYQLSDKVTQREKFMIALFYHNFVTANFQKGIESAALWSNTYPNDPTAREAQAFTYGALGQRSKAATEGLECIRLDPNRSTCYALTAWNQMALDQLDSAKETYRTAISRNLNHPYLFLVGYGLAFLSGDKPSTARLVDEALSMPGAEDSMLASLASSEAYYGRLSKAREYTRRAVEAAQRIGAKERAALWLMNQALWEMEIGNAPFAVSQCAAARSFFDTRDIGMQATVILAAAGDRAGMERMASALAQDSPTDTLLLYYWLPAARASAEIRRDNPSNAIEYLAAVTPFELSGNAPMVPVYLRGKAFLLAHRGSEAIGEFRKFVDHPGRVVNHPYGALAQLQIARAYAMQGDTAKAKAAYQDFLSLWKNADPDIHILNRAKAEYMTLR